MDSIGLVGYGLASVALLIFSLLLLTTRQRTLLGSLVLFSSTILALLNGFAAAQIYFALPLPWLLVLEPIKLLFLTGLVIATAQNIQQGRLLFANAAIKQLLLFSLPLIAVNSYLLLGAQSYKYSFLILLVLNLWLLVQLEQLLRRAGTAGRWALWPIIISFGALAVFDFVIFAQASMLNQISFELWFTRGYLALLAAPLLLITSRRLKNWSVDIFISREVVFYSSMLLIAGLYLLLMAFAGYLINWIGGQWGEIFTILFVMFGSVVLAALLITEKFRRQLKVFIAKHFFANRYDYREAWLQVIEQLEQNRQQDYYQNALKIILKALDIDKGAIVKVEGKVGFKLLHSHSIAWDDALAEQLNHALRFCQQTQWIIDVNEYQQQPAHYHQLKLNTEVLLEHQVKIIVPVLGEKGLYGLFLLSGIRSTNKPLDWEQRDFLAAIVKQLNYYLALNEANQSLTDAKQFDAFNRMSAFLVHDLKNVQAQLSLINKNAEKHRDNPAFIDDVFETVDSATQRLDKMLQQLRNKLQQHNLEKTVQLSDLIDKICEQRNASLPAITIEKIDDVSLTLDDQSFGSVLNHLLQNAQEATPNTGSVTINAQVEQQKLQIVIADNGCGMSQSFIKERLFKAFDTTKGNAGMGIGVYEAKQFIEGLGGSIAVESVEGQGSQFTLTIPLQQQD